ncbi:RHS repeat-associated core domain-containing protein, partial [Candidatus Chloroploca sp. Khr17]|uniref:RHS repeat-associated core domain-containing protein n=1 Tax=Candidatus Chloroploca sp. Khr17 TaxID=2496869 RepID=UPI001F105D6D
GTGALDLQHSTIRNNNGDGLRIAAGYSSFTSAHNTFRDNTRYGLNLGINASFDDNSSTFTDNGIDAYLAGGTISQPVTWNLNPAYSFFVSSDITVGAPGELDILPGTVVKFAQYGGIWVDGSLRAEGTAEAPISFTDWRDDTVGGDANNNGAANGPAANWWRWINVRATGTASFSYAQIAYAGWNDSVALLKSGSGDLSLQHSTIRNTNGDGLRLNGSTGTHTLVRNQFISNTTGILVQNQAETLVVSNHLIEGNTTFGVRNVSSAEVDARSTWWGDAAGPRHASNPEGLGDTVSDGVLFTPWRTTPSSGQILAPRRDGTLVAGDWLRFSGSTVDDVQATYRWTFGDGRSFATRTPGLIAFPATGVVTVTYTATSDGEDDPYPDAQTFTVVADTGNLPDLVLTQVTVPMTLAVGQPASMTYRVQNTGQGDAGPTWQDAVYLSTDANLDRTDQQLGSVASNRTLAPGASYEQTMLVTLPTLDEGTYNLIVVVNDTWQVLELRRLNNEQATLITAQVPALQAGVDQVSTYTTGRVEHFYRLNATGGGQHLVLDASRVPATLEVSLRFGALPTRGTYDERIRGGERLVVPAATAGQWYLLIAGNATTDGTYTIQYDLTALALTGSAPARQGTQADLELALTGAGLLSPLEIALVGSTGTVYEAQTVDVDSSTAARATFPAGTVPAGVYDVRVTHHAQTATLPTAVTLIEGGTAKLDLNLILPSRFGYHQLATVLVEYTNSGDAPMPAPLLLVTATQNGQPGAIITLEQHRLSGGFWTSAMPQGFANDVQFLAAGETPGVLQPGETRRVPVYYAGWQRPWDFSYPPFDWEVKVLDANDTTPVDWAALKDGMRPDYVQPDAWDVLWANYTTLAGNTWGDYVRMLSQNAQYLARLGQRVDDITTLQAFSFRQADGLNPMRVLASGMDAVVEGPGLTIAFERSYLQPLSRRFELGDLGRGWTHNWHQGMTVSDDGTVSITDLTGTPRIFQPDSRYSGRYLAQPGDQATLRTADGGYRLTEASGLIQFYRDGKLQYLEEPNGNRITITYTGEQMTRLEHSSGGLLAFTYTPAGYLATITDQDGRQTTYTYNGAYLASVTTDDGRTTTYTYATEGAAQHALASIGQPDGVTQNFTYDSLGRLATTSRDDGQEQISFTYASGRVNMTDALGNTNRFFFDTWSRIVKIENALGQAVVMSFNDFGNLTATTDPDGLSTTFAYDLRGNLTETTDAMRRTTRFAYERTTNRLVAVTDATGNRTNYSYDAKGNLSTIAYPDGSSEAWSYDAQGNPTARTNRRSNAIATTYDTAGRITSKTYADASTVTYTYDARGNLATAVDATGTTTFTYDQHDYLTRIDFPQDRWLSFTYDTVGRRSTSTDQLDYQVTYHYDEAGRLSRVADGDGDLVTYSYDELGRLARQELGNGIVTTYGYDPAGRLLSQINRNPDATELARFVYTYDRRGRRIAMETHYGVWTYTYDDVGQLLSAILTSSEAGIADQDLRYEYDAAGNRVRTTINGVEEAYAANNLNQYTTVGDQTYTYDLDGNLIREEGPGGVTVYTYNDENRLTGVTRGGDTWAYTYDALGNRVAIDENGAVTHYVVDPLGLGNTVGTYANDGSLLARYAYGSSLLQRWSATDGASYYSFDPLGNVSEMTGAAGVGQNAYAYRPFGETVLRTETIANPFEFMGAFGVMADTTGLHHVRARQYDAQRGRFNAMDPLGFGSGDLNGYRYAMNNPMSFVDPDGEIPFAVIVIGKWAIGAYTTYRASCGVADIYYANQDELRKKREANLIDDPLDARSRLSSRHNLRSGTKNAETAIEFVAGGTIPHKDALDISRDALNKKKTWGETFFPCSFSRKPIPPPNPPAGSGTSGAGGSAGSQDPNEKISVAGFGAGNFVRADTLVTYRIDFENYPDATAPAQVVTIRDPLSTDLDWSTLELTELGFGDVILQVPPGRQEFQTVVDYTYTDDEYDFTIEVHVEAWLEDGQLNVNFTSIDPVTNLPPTVDKGFLPPETDPETGRGTGFVAYTIRPQPGLPSGTAIRNIATIQFDFSLEIDTNQVDPMDKSQGTDPTKEALVTFDRLAPTSSVTALPAVTSSTPFTVTWQGADDTNGAGVGSYDVYVQENGGAWTPWLTSTTTTAAAFDGQDGQTYSFYVVATDNVGHRESKPAQAEATTTVAVQSRYTVYLPLTVR